MPSQLRWTGGSFSVHLMHLVKMNVWLSITFEGPVLLKHNRKRQDNVASKTVCTTTRRVNFLE